jgi:hypothetical protein
VLPERAKVDGQVVGAAEGIGVIVADGGAVAAEGVLVDPACLGVLAESVVGHAEVVG